MVEFALALPVLLLLVMGVIEFGRLLMTYSAVFSAAREASRYGAAVGMNPSGVPFDHDCDGMRAAAVRVGNLGGVRANDIGIRMLGSDNQPKQINSVDVGSNWCTSSNTGWPTVLGDIVEVTVAVNYAPVVPLVPIPQLTVSGSNGGIRSTSSRTIVTDVQVPSTAFGGGGAAITYTLNINYVPTDHTGGTVTASTAAANPDTGPYTAGTVVTLTPNPAAGWHFVNWTGPDGAQVDAGNHITMDMNKTITANFVQDPYALVMTQVGSGVTNPPVGSTLIAPGTNVTLSATPAVGWRFVGWSGTDISGSANPVTITMDKAKNITATFTNSQQYTLTTSVTSGNGTVSPASGTFTYGDTVTVVATPGDLCYEFTSFQVNGRGDTHNPLPVTITGNTSVAATFQPKNFTLTAGIITSPSGLTGGTVSMNPPGGSYACDTVGRTITLTAAPLPGWTFYGWTGVDASNGLTATVTLLQTNPNRTVIATFVQDQYLLSVAVDPVGTGTYAVYPNTNKFTYNQSVTVSPNPERGYGFSSWSFPGVSNAKVNADNSITINPIVGNMPLTVHFVPVCAPTEKILETQTASGSPDEITYNIQNSTAMDVTIDQLAVKWAKNKTLVQVTLNGNVIWQDAKGVGSIAILPSTSLTSDLALRRLLANSANNTLVMTFSGKDNAVGYEMMAITYSNPCP